MECPQCGGSTWNNAQKNAQRAEEGKKPLPLWACKDKDGCGWIKWPPKTQGGGSGTGSRGHRAGSPAGPRTSRPLTPLYLACLQDGKASVEHVFGAKATPELCLNAAATLFTAASRDGAPLRAVKPKPAPPPPPPPVEEAEEFEEFPPALKDEADDLPF